jgi:hypothetical protein
MAVNTASTLRVLSHLLSLSLRPHVNNEDGVMISSWGTFVPVLDASHDALHAALAAVGLTDAGVAIQEYRWVKLLLPVAGDVPDRRYAILAVCPPDAPAACLVVYDRDWALAHQTEFALNYHHHLKEERE